MTTEVTTIPETIEFHLEVRRGDRGEILTREPIPDSCLQPLAEEGLWLARRRGLIDDPGGAWWRVAPILEEPSKRIVSNAVAELELCLGEHGEAPSLTRRYPLDSFREPIRGAVERLILEEKLARGDEYRVSVLAHRPQLGPGGNGEGPPPRLPARHKQTPLPMLEGSLQEWVDRSTLLNGAASAADDTPVFITREAFEQALRSCRSPGTREGAAALAGTLRRQHSPEPEIFAVIEASFEARHAEQERFSVTPSMDTFIHIERQIARRRKRMNRPEEILIGIAHAHNFEPAIDRDGESLCASCPTRSTCGLDSAYYSADDARFHTALFVKQAFAVGLLWGFTPRREDAFKIYGFRNGSLQERAIWLVE